MLNFLKSKFLISILIIPFLTVSLSSKKIKAPDFSLYDLDRNVVRLSSKEFKNKIVILNFWATWCPPCRMEIPGFVNFYKNYKDKGVKLLGICLDVDKVERIKNFAKNYKMNYPILIGTKEVVKDYGGIQGIPTTFIIDHNGFIVERILGYLEEEELSKYIDKLIEIRDSTNKNSIEK